MIFVDTGVWFSLLVLRDPNHAKCAGWFESVAEPLVTSDYVIDETLTLLLMRDERRKALAFGELVIIGNTAIVHWITEEQFNRSWIQFQKLSSAGLSFTDCTSHVVARDLQITKIAAHDQHFLSMGKFELIP
jgi:predicted nucleic acid-binding protein